MCEGFYFWVNHQDDVVPPAKSGSKNKDQYFYILKEFYVPYEKPGEISNTTLAANP